VDDTTAPCAEKAADHPLDDLELSRAKVMVQVAKIIVAGDHPYAPGGRGAPGGFDGYGFVRWCVSFAAAWRPGVGYDVEAAVGNRLIHDLVDYTGWPDLEPSGQSICSALESWGMVRVDQCHPLKTLPGDVIITLGQGPACCIVTDAGNQDRGELVAMVWAPKGPAIRSNLADGRAPLRAYRWPTVSAEA